MIDSIGYSVEDDYNVENSINSAAKKHFRDGDYSAALKLFLGLAKSGTSAKLYFDIGLCYYKLNDLNNALEYFTHSTKLDPNNSNAFSYLGNCYFKKLDANNAIENWSFARSLNPSDEFVCLNLAIAFFAKNMNYESTYFYEKYIKYSQKTNLAQYKSIKKNLEQKRLAAEEYYLKAEQNRSVKAGYLAEANYKMAMKKYPIDNRYSLGLANLYFDTKSYQQAVPYYQLALKAGNINKKNIYLKLAECFETISDYRMAYCYYKRYLSFTTSSQKEYLEYARRMSKMKNLIQESDNELTLQSAKEYYENNQYNDALVEYENFLLMNPENKEYTEIINTLKSFTNSEEFVSKMYLKKGNELFNEGKHNGANKYFTQVMNLSNPKSNTYKIAKSKIINV